MSYLNVTTQCSKLRALFPNALVNCSDVNIQVTYHEQLLAVETFLFDALFLVTGVELRFWLKQGKEKKDSRQGF